MSDIEATRDIVVIGVAVVALSKLMDFGNSASDYINDTLIPSVTEGWNFVSTGGYIGEAMRNSTPDVPITQQAQSTIKENSNGMLDFSFGYSGKNTDQTIAITPVWSSTVGYSSIPSDVWSMITAPNTRTETISIFDW